MVSQTKDIDDLFFPKLRDVADELGAHPAEMLAVMYSESGCRADAWNDNPKSLPPEKRWNASGLIQFMPATLKGLGWTRGHAAFRMMSPTVQLDFVRRYYAPHTGYLGSVGGLYVATFLPALVSHAGDASFILTAKKGPLGWAYAPNAAFDANGDFAITVGELEDAVARNARGPRWSELLARLAGETVSTPAVTAGVDLGTTLGIQRALARLGIDPGPIDGLPGRRTSAAIAAFQKHSPPLVVDGICGPRTKATLQAAFDLTP